MDAITRVQNAARKEFIDLIEEFLSPKDYSLLKEGEDGLTVFLNMVDVDNTGFAKSRRFTDEEAVNDLFEALEAEAQAVEMMQDGTEYFYFHSCYLVLI